MSSPLPEAVNIPSAQIFCFWLLPSYTVLSFTKKYIYENYFINSTLNTLKAMRSNCIIPNKIRFDNCLFCVINTDTYTHTHWSGLYNGWELYLIIGKRKISAEWGSKVTRIKIKLKYKEKWNKKNFNSTLIQSSKEVVNSDFINGE